MEIVVQDNGINWTWYHSYTMAGNAVTLNWSNSFHKYDEGQGASQHPVATHCHLQTYEPLNEANRARWPSDWVEKHEKNWARHCAEACVDPASVARIHKVYPVGDSKTILTLVEVKPS